MASKLLDDAGWEVGDDGLRKNKNGATLDIEILNDSQAFTRIIEPFIENLKSLGVNAVHTKIDNAQMTEREDHLILTLLRAIFQCLYTLGINNTLDLKQLMFQFLIKQVLRVKL